MHNYLYLSTLCGALLAIGCGASEDTGGTAIDAAQTGDCIENETSCDGNSYLTCVGGEWEVTRQCIAQRCDANFGCVDCTPNQNYCDGNTVASCDASGNTSGVVEVCREGTNCENGTCRDLCADAVASRSYLGCEYWAVDLDNAVQANQVADGLFGCSLAKLLSPGVVEINDMRVCEINGGGTFADECDSDGTCPTGYTCVTEDMCALSADNAPFAIVVSNPQDFAITVTIEDGSGTTMNTAVPAHEVVSIYPGSLGFPNLGVTGTSLAPKGYKMTTTAPVVAYQFNPLDNENVFSNDGSLLIPQHAFDVEYYALTWHTLARRPEGRDFNGYLSVVGWMDGTEVTVTPSANVRASSTQPAIAANTPSVFTLNAFDVLNLEAVADGDLSGSRIQVTSANDATVGVFSGHEAVSILSANGTCCADHIEEMMLPTSTWGTEYAVARSFQRTDESDVLRIMAQTAGTVVTVSSGATCPTLGPGEFCEIDISQDVEISATEPIQIGHYLKSVIDGLGAGSGDPSLAIAVPIEQFRSEYDFLVPAEYDNQYISVVADSGAQVRLDGVDVQDQLAAVTNGSKVAGRIAVTPGQHDISCTGGCGLEVYGYSSAVSYLFAGGLDLEQIVID